MRLLADDYDGVYVWVEDHDENIELSPRFDYQEDAIHWQQRLRKIFTGKDEAKEKNSKIKE